MAAAEGRLDHARGILNGREREPWRGALAGVRHISAGLCAPLVAAFGRPRPDRRLARTNSWTIGDLARPIHEHVPWGRRPPSRVLASALGRTDEAEERLLARGELLRGARAPVPPRRRARRAGRAGSRTRRRKTVPRPARHGRTRGAPDAPRAAPRPVRPPAALNSARPATSGVPPVTERNGVEGGHPGTSGRRLGQPRVSRGTPTGTVERHGEVDLERHHLVRAHRQFSAPESLRPRSRRGVRCWHHLQEEPVPVEGSPGR